MSEPHVNIGVTLDRPSGDIVVTVDINGSPWFDGSGPTLEAAFIEALTTTATYAFEQVQNVTT